ncbi:MAG: hypothetical protein FJ293_01410 [Planctomycetes bacterium]|nr:hypothetical protein [Planctomycetota bacterium]
MTPRNAVLLSPSVLAGALGAALACSCATPQDRIADLGDLYATRDAPRATYAPDVVDRGLGARFGRAWCWPWDEPAPLTEREPLEDPVGFALDRLDELEQTLDDDALDPVERVVAVVTLADLATLDRSRIVRQRAFAVLARLCDALPATPPRPLASHDEAALLAAIEPLLAFCESPTVDAAPLAPDREAELARAAAALEAVAVERIALAQRFALLAAKGARRAERVDRSERAAADGGAPVATAALERAAIAQARQVAWLATAPAADHPRGIGDPGDGVRAVAGQVRIRLDPVAATVDLGRAWSGELNRAFAPGIVTLVRIEWLQALAQAPIRGANVHPSLRGALAQELDDEDAAVAHWARAAIGHLLERDAATPSAELKAAWLALGEWQPARAGS